MASYKNANIHNMVTNIWCDCCWHVCLFFCLCAAASGAEDVALYVGIVAVALCLTLLLIILVLVYRRKKEGLDADVADSSILTTGFQPMGIKPSKPGVWAPRRAARSSRLLFLYTIHPSSRCFTPILSSQCPCSCATCGYSNSQCCVCAVFTLNGGSHSFACHLHSSKQLWWFYLNHLWSHKWEETFTRPPASVGSDLVIGALSLFPLILPRNKSAYCCALLFLHM